MRPPVKLYHSQARVKLSENHFSKRLQKAPRSLRFQLLVMRFSKWYVDFGEDCDGGAKDVKREHWKTMWTILLWCSDNDKAMTTEKKTWYHGPCSLLIEHFECGSNLLGADSDLHKIDRTKTGTRRWTVLLIELERFRDSSTAAQTPPKLNPNSTQTHQNSS